MAGRFASTVLTCAVAVAVAAAAGCSSHGQTPDDGGSQEADFEGCAMSPAVDYMPGLMATSASGAYAATLVSATTMFSDGSSTDTAATGTDSWVVSIANAGDAAPPGPADVTVTAEKPWMPKHTHGSPTVPAVTMGDPGMFTESGMIIFQTGYWSVTLDLQPPSGAADKVTFAICIRQ